MLFDQRELRPQPAARERARHRPDEQHHANLIADIEALRGHLGIERWLVSAAHGGARSPSRTPNAIPPASCGLVLFGVAQRPAQENDWLFRGRRRDVLRAEWQRLVEACRPEESRTDVVEAYHAAAARRRPGRPRAGRVRVVLWESATPEWPPVPGLAEQFETRVRARVRASGDALRPARLLARGRAHPPDVGALADIPGVLVNGRFDFQGPIGTAWRLHRVWPRSELVIVEDAGHAYDHPGIMGELVAATDRFATR